MSTTSNTVHPDLYQAQADYDQAVRNLLNNVWHNGSTGAAKIALDHVTRAVEMGETKPAWYGNAVAQATGQRDYLDRAYRELAGVLPDDQRQTLARVSLLWEAVRATATKAYSLS